MTKEKHRDSADKDHLYKNKKEKRLQIQTGKRRSKWEDFNLSKSGRAHRAGQTALRLLDILGRLHLLSDLDVI